MITQASDALQRLREGNARFVAGAGALERHADAERRAQLVDGQHPSAIVLGCSDSRVPPEVVFDQGLGELFVVRVAGNVVTPSQLGSVEFAAEQLGARLAVVLGHSQCGAVKATLDEIERPSEARSANLSAIVDRIRPALEDLVQSDAGREPLLARAVRANIRHAADHLRHGSPVLEELIERDGLVIVEAEYSLATGVVELLDASSPD